MGVAARKRNVAELAEQLFPWAWTGFTLSVIAGFLEFATAAGDWAPDKVFHVKLTLIVLSVIFTIVVQMGVKKWAQAAEIPTAAKIIAVVSLLLWIATILSASEIPALEGLG
jgi:amino acid transporter